MMRGVLVLAAVAALGGLAGCSSIRSTYDSWFGAPAPSSKPSPLPQIHSTATTRALWQGRVSEAQRNVLFPAVSGNTVWAAGANGEIAGFNAGSGAQQARFNAGQPLAGGVSANARVVVLATRRGEIQALDHNGKSLWKIQAPGETLAPPAITGDLVIARVGDGAVLGLDLRSGKRRWLYQRSAPALSVRSFGGVAVRRSVIFAGFAGGRLIALSAADGGVLWDSVVALPKGTTELERVADITSPPVVDDSRVCAVAFQGRLACFDVARGTAIWARDISSFSGLGADTRNVYVTDDKSAITALDKSTGGSVWKQDKLAGRGVTRPLALGRFVIVGDYQGYVHLLSREDGSFVGRVATDGSAIAAPPGALDLSSFVVQTRNGGVYAFAAQ
jgi:outer membrane protein assembly factor BamB